MSERINRDAWAHLIAQLVREETRGKKATFARRVGVDPRTVTRWLAGDVDVAETSVRDVARAVGRTPRELLIAVGYYSADELGAAQQPPIPTDEAVELVATDPLLDDKRKREIIDRLYELAAQDEARRRDLAQFMIDQARGA